MHVTKTADCSSRQKVLDGKDDWFCKYGKICVLGWLVYTEYVEYIEMTHGEKKWGRLAGLDRLLSGDIVPFSLAH